LGQGSPKNSIKSPWEYKVKKMAEEACDPREANGPGTPKGKQMEHRSPLVI